MKLVVIAGTPGSGKTSVLMHVSKRYHMGVLRHIDGSMEYKGE